MSDDKNLVDLNQNISIKSVNTGAFGPSEAADTSGFGGLVEVVTSRPAAIRPFGGWFDQICDELARALRESGLSFEQVVSKVVIAQDQITFEVRREHLVNFAQVLRDDPALRFEMCLGVMGAHWPKEKDKELHAIYPFLSITHNKRVFAEVTAPDSDPHIPSLTGIYAANNWHEREVFDFFGIIFDGHPALTRIQMPDDWSGHPQRKDYPLGGIPVEYKGATIAPPDERRSYRG
jgi:NADH-quinone oxidoreductase subunit C